MKRQKININNIYNTISTGNNQNNAEHTAESSPNLILIEKVRSTKLGITHKEIYIENPTDVTITLDYSEFKDHPSELILVISEKTGINRFTSPIEACMRQRFFDKIKEVGDLTSKPIHNSGMSIANYQELDIAQLQNEFLVSRSTEGRYPHIFAHKLKDYNVLSDNYFDIWYKHDYSEYRIATIHLPTEQIQSFVDQEDLALILKLPYLLYGNDEFQVSSKSLLCNLANQCMKSKIYALPLETYQPSKFLELLTPKTMEAASCKPDNTSQERAVANKKQKIQADSCNSEQVKMRSEGAFIQNPPARFDLTGDLALDLGYDTDENLISWVELFDEDPLALDLFN
ncbi:MAG: hypothetical protein SFT93_04985 [Rickettsiaceae bacterium]|nr:hypothetical protein [Rickettsiaceae bacterium]